MIIIQKIMATTRIPRNKYQKMVSQENNMMVSDIEYRFEHVVDNAA
jgi:hypothetical protein